MDSESPLIVPRSSHCISRKQIKPAALKVLYRLREQGFKAHLVGGCVRDLLLGREPKDFDIATDATPGQLKKMFRNCRLVGRRFRLAHLHFGDDIIEVATFRALHALEPAAEGEEEDPRLVRSEEGMILRDNVFGSAREDSLRRDFTINALSYDIADFSIIDHSGGMRDLEAGVVRTIGDPRVRIVEDPVRMLRAVRFSALLGFTIDAETREAIEELAPVISRAAPPRLYEELLKLFLCGEGEATYQLLRRTGLFAHLFPGVSRWLDSESGGFPHAGISRALAHVDDLVRERIILLPPLLLAFVFGEYIAEQADGMRGRGMPPQRAMEEAIAAFMEEAAPVVLIPHRVGMVLRDILYAPFRLRKIPGRRPQQFAARPGFADWLAYFRFSAGDGAEDARVIAWWEEMASSGMPPSQGAAPSPAAAGAPRKRRRGRRRGRKGSGTKEESQT